MASVTAQHHVVYLAHGVGNREDLPIPAHDAFIGAALALIVSFVVLGLAWRTSRFHGDDSGRPLPRWLADIIDSPVTHAVLVSGSGGSGLNWPGLFSRKGCTDPSQGV